MRKMYEEKINNKISMRKMVEKKNIMVNKYEKKIIIKYNDSQK